MSRAPKDGEPVDQVRYLISYLKREECGVRSFVVEQPYVDRHWLEEYTGYYATALRPPAPKASRLHFFRRALSDDELAAVVTAAANGNCEREEQALSADYVGFAVVRPLPSAPLGRTVLRPYGDDAARCYEPAQIEHTVHLAGLELRVPGIPFQQQDRAVGACATAALWSALSKVMRTDGRRSLTPLEVTRSATAGALQSRAFPALEGLNLEQMAAAIHAAGYEPHKLRPANEDDVFLLALKCYLRSGIPVVACVDLGNTDLHAVTLVGFREVESLATSPVRVNVNGGALSARGVVRFYVHDDRLGAYARLKYTQKGTDRVLRLEPTDKGYEHLEQDMTFGYALVPLYPKLRLTAEELLELGGALVPLWRRLLPEHHQKLEVDARFWLGGQYLRHALRSLPVEGASRLAQLASTVLLSRYVGVLSFKVDGGWVFDVIFDTTDIMRSDRGGPGPMLAVVCADERFVAPMRQARPDAAVF